MGANDTQHGGTHYKDREYQHWDWVCDVGLPYLIGCATKYISRWREKGGHLDLRKAVHYIEKAQERKIEARPSWRGPESSRFLAQHGPLEARAMFLVLSGDYDGAVMAIKGPLLDSADK